MRKLTKKHYLAAGVATAVIIGGAGTAFAYWSSSGTGTGSASTGSSSAFVVTLDAPTGGALSPGGPVDTVGFHVKNTNSGAQNFASAVATVVDTSNSGCTAADFSVSGLTAAYGDLASGATSDGSFQLQMVDSGANQDACQNVTVNLKVAVN